MAIGKPVVAYASGAIPEIVRHRATDLLAPTGNLPVLTTHLEEPVLDEQLAIQLGKMGRRVAENGFSLERVGATHMKLIEQVADRSVEIC